MTSASRLTLCILIIALNAFWGMAYVVLAAESVGALQSSAVVNRGVVEVVTGRAGDGSVRMAEEIAAVIDDGATRRVMPVVGKGAIQNLTDLKYLRGIDLAIVPADTLEYAREQRLFPGIEN